MENIHENLEIENEINNIESENNLLKEEIKNIENNIEKIIEAKDLLLDYDDALKNQVNENLNIMNNIKELTSELNKLPNFIKKRFIKNEELKRLINSK